MAARECRSVQVLRPSSSTSGGQSESVVGLATAAAVGDIFLPALGFVDDFIIAIQSADEVHVRQLQEESAGIRCVQEDIHTACHLCLRPHLWAIASGIRQ